MKYILSGLLLFNIASASVINSNYDLKFNSNKIDKYQENLKYKLDFNKGVNLLEKREYDKAISFFKITEKSKKLKYPSILNKAYIYFKQNLTEKSIIEFEKLVKIKNYNSKAYYYLYLLTKDKLYLKRALITLNKKNLLETDKKLLSQIYIERNEYLKSLKVEKSLKVQNHIKLAVLNIKLKEYKNSIKNIITFQNKNQLLSKRETNISNWLLAFNYIKINNIEDSINTLKLIDKTSLINKEYELNINFKKTNINIENLKVFNLKKKIDFIYYFSPYIFYDNLLNKQNLTNFLVNKDLKSINKLEKNIDYFNLLLKLSKEDPLLKTKKLKEYMDKNKDYNSSILYNIGLSYAQTYDYEKAYKYFHKAFIKNPGNNLYGIMKLITAKILKIKIKEEKLIISNLNNSNNKFNKESNQIYNILIKNNKTKIEANTIFQKSLNYLISDNKKESDLIKDHYKDGLVFLLNEVLYSNNIMKLQDKTPLDINDNFLSGSLLKLDYYLDVIKLTKLNNRVNFEFKDKTPSYFYIKVMKLLEENRNKEALEILNNNLLTLKTENKKINMLYIIALIKNNKLEDAKVELNIMNNIYQDNETNYLLGILLIKELKLKGIETYLRDDNRIELIDIELSNIDSLL